VMRIRIRLAPDHFNNQDRHESKNKKTGSALKLKARSGSASKKCESAMLCKGWYTLTWWLPRWSCQSFSGCMVRAQCQKKMSCLNFPQAEKIKNTFNMQCYEQFIIFMCTKNTSVLDFLSSASFCYCNYLDPGKIKHCKQMISIRSSNLGSCR
jgi:hypothetical protein